MNILLGIKYFLVMSNDHFVISLFHLTEYCVDLFVFMCWSLFLYFQSLFLSVSLLSLSPVAITE